ncbi:MAG: carbohydrate ABC transporter permease, partial [Kiritimatiellota bacterium]|nr:carbohydrate ABC transporter permease [Kiritimatiellota bacterium]
FPAEVAMIPGFLLLRNLGLLNTFAALVLPGLCSGIGILWLKGYFDSLSSELFEAALIDGASEFQIFRRIVLPLAKPVLAVVALGSFTVAYTGFMWAFVTCQDPKMWTLMVWLYQFQTSAGVPAQMASFVVASIPTLLVFVFCQNIIMRGIVVPTLK